MNKNAEIVKEWLENHNQELWISGAPVPFNGEDVMVPTILVEDHDAAKKKHILPETFPKDVSLEEIKAGFSAFLGDSVPEHQIEVTEENGVPHVILTAADQLSVNSNVWHLHNIGFCLTPGAVMLVSEEAKEGLFINGGQNKTKEVPGNTAHVESCSLGSDPELPPTLIL